MKILLNEARLMVIERNGLVEICVGSGADLTAPPLVVAVDGFIAERLGRAVLAAAVEARKVGGAVGNTHGSRP